MLATAARQLSSLSDPIPSTFGEDGDVHTLAVRASRARVGFSLNAIRQLLALWQDRSRTSQDMKRLALETVAEVRRKMAEIEAMAHRSSTWRRVAVATSGRIAPPSTTSSTVGGEHADRRMRGRIISLVGALRH